MSQEKISNDNLSDLQLLNIAYNIKVVFAVIVSLVGSAIWQTLILKFLFLLKTDL